MEHSTLKYKRFKVALLLLVLPVLWLTGCGERGPGKGDTSDTAIESLTTDAGYPNKVLWGDTHVHTSNSPDAFGFGVRLDAEAAYRFARGEEVTSTMGVKAKLARPLDFLAVADHSDGLGFTRRIYDGPRFLLPNDQLKRWHDMMHESAEGSQRVTAEMIDMAGTGQAEQIGDHKKQERATKSIWKKHLKITERFNQPGVFTTFAAFEYTSMPNGNNLHRVVIFRDGIEKARQVIPYSLTLGDDVERLWDYMDNYEKNTGGDVLAIPHNSNVSNGLMFELNGPGGGPMSAEYAQRRAEKEPLVEITQIKGDSESHPFLSPDDEFAGYGTAGWDLGNLDMSIKKQPDMLGGDYVREALKRGLLVEQSTSHNPYQLGLIGSTDSHTSLATADEDNFFGKHTGNEPAPGRDRVTPAMNLGEREGRYNWQYLSSGYAGVWATSNTREAIFDAMARREVYGTTGPRMTLRIFGGWNFDENMLQGDWISTGYEQGVPMGGVLPARNESSGAPTFIVEVLKDPIGANLDRVQIVKGWVDAAGAMHEKVFDVHWSAREKRPVRNGRVTPVGDTVDLSVPGYENSIGAPLLNAVWRDPQFDPAQRAFYYMRALEIPTPRWVAYDAIRFGLELPDNIPMQAQERGYSSPIWYIPSANATLAHSAE